MGSTTSYDYSFTSNMELALVQFLFLLVPYNAKTSTSWQSDTHCADPSTAWTFLKRQLWLSVIQPKSHAFATPPPSWKYHWCVQLDSIFSALSGGFIELNGSSSPFAHTHCPSRPLTQAAPAASALSNLKATRR